MKTPKLLLLAFCTCAFTACSPVMYAPKIQNTPLLSEKGESNISASIGNGMDTEQITFQGATALTDNIAIMGGGSLFFGDGSDVGGDGQLFELGAGYFNKVGPKWVFESYGFVAAGFVRNDIKASTGFFGTHFPARNVSANLLQFGAQPNFGFKSKYFSAILSSRVLYNKYVGASGSHERYVEELKEARGRLLHEPALTFQVGSEIVKLKLQLAVSYDMIDSDNANYGVAYSNDEYISSIGLAFNF